MSVRSSASRDARFARRRELCRRLRPSLTAWFPLGYLPPWPAALAWWRRFSRSAAPACLRGPRLCLPAADLARHVLITGLTGAHKTTAVILPALADAAAAGVSAVAFDLKYGERDSLAGAIPEWWRHGRAVLVYAPLDGASLRWNPLGACRSMGDAYALAVHLFPDDARETADFGYWTGAERHVCAALVWGVVTDGGAPSIARLRALAEAGPDAVVAYLRRHPRAGEINARLGAYGAMLPKDRAGILQGIAARLEPWADERVALSTADPGDNQAPDAISLARLRREPTLLLIGVPQAALLRLRPVCQLFMRMLAAEMLQPRGGDETVPVVYVLEELPAWGPLPGLADHLATFRSRDVAIVATVQSEAQGEAVYGASGWAAISANFVTKIYLSSLADPDAERLSHALGTTTVARTSHSRVWGGNGRRDAAQTHLVEVPLSKPEDLQGIDTAEDEILLRCSRLPPARLWCPPFHARFPYAGLIPEIAPSTVEIAIRHRLRSSGDALTASPKGAMPAPVEAGGAVLSVVAADDADTLNGFVRALLGSDRDGPDPHVVCRGDRAVEVRVQPAVAFRLLGGRERAPAVVHRWVALRWVRRVQPLFVLERRAVEALEPQLLRRLVTHSHGPAHAVDLSAVERDKITCAGAHGDGGGRLGT